MLRLTKALQRTHRQQLQTLCMPHAASQWFRPRTDVYQPVGGLPVKTAN